jgi:hypothetical protein
MKEPNISSWPSRQPLGAITAVITAIIVFVAVAIAQVQLTWTPLQHYYLPDLMLYKLAVVLKLPNTQLRLIAIARPDRKLTFAQDSDFVSGQMHGIDGRNYPFSLSDGARSNNRVYIYLDRKRPYETAQLGQWLRTAIYSGMDVWGFVKIPFACAVAVLILGIWITFPSDKARARIRRFGRRLRGPEYVSARDFIRRMRGDGIGFLTKNHSILRWLTGQKYLMMRVNRRAENSGFLILGATGSGKTALCFQLIDQAIERGDRLVVIDPALEFTQRFYNPATDIILNPGDQRTRAWDLASEIGSDAEARAVACSMLPQRKYENPFFVEAAQRVLAELLKYRPSTKDLAKWLADPSEVDRRVAGTEAALMIDAHAGPQRVGVLATLAMFGEALRSLPDIDENHKGWSSAAWAKDGQGSIFLTFPQMMREQIRPLIGAWLDLLIYRLQRAGVSFGKKTFFLIDEMPTLGRLPALTNMLTENRKSENPAVICVQDKSQLDEIFGKLASTMLSMPATKIILRTSEPESSKWGSQAIGNVEYEQLRESESSNPNQGHSRSEHTDIVTRPLVMPEELDGLPPLKGYIKHGNLVADVDTGYLDFPCIQPGFVPRTPSPDPKLFASAPELKDTDPSQSQGDNINSGLLFE